MLHVLQAGHWDSEGQQRLVSLTAQVTSQAAQLTAAEQRCKEALVSLPNQGAHGGLQGVATRMLSALGYSFSKLYRA